MKREQEEDKQKILQKSILRSKRNPAQKLSFFDNNSIIEEEKKDEEIDGKEENKQDLDEEKIGLLGNNAQIENNFEEVHEIHSKPSRVNVQMMPHESNELPENEGTRK